MNSTLWLTNNDIVTQVSSIFCFRVKPNYVEPLVLPLCICSTLYRVKSSHKAAIRQYGNKYCARRSGSRSENEARVRCTDTTYGHLIPLQFILWKFICVAFVLMFYEFCFSCYLLDGLKCLNIWLINNFNLMG